MNTVEFDKVERILEESVHVSFRTRQLGIYQLGYKKSGVDKLRREPDFMSFTSAEQEYMEEIAAICWKIVFDGKMPNFNKTRHKV